MFSRHRFPVPGGPVGHWLSVVEGGDRRRPTIVFVHGAAGAWGNFHPQGRHFVERYHILAPELRGHGGSPWPGESGLDDFYGDLEAFMLQRTSERVFLVAHSFGGCLASMFASRHPERIAGLVLLNTGGHIPRSPVFRAMRLFSGQASNFRRHYPWMISTDTQVSQHLLRRTLRQWDCWGDYLRIQAPTAVMLGSLDVLIPVSFAPRMRCLLRDCTMTVVRGAGHVLMSERPELVNQTIDQLLSRLSF